MMPEITVAEDLVILLKRTFYPNHEWSQGLSMTLAAMLTKLKIEARKYFPYDTEIERLRKMARFTPGDLYDGLMIPDTTPPPKQGTPRGMFKLSFKFDIADPRKGEPNENQTAKPLLDGLQGPVRPST